MRAILGKLGFRRSIGLFVNDQDVSVCVLANTPIGRVTVHHGSQPINGRPIREVLQDSIQQWSQPRRGVRTPVALGVPQRMIFHGSHAVTNANRNASPETMLESLLKTPSVKVDEMIVDLRQTVIGKRPIARIAACRRKNLEPLLDALQQEDTRLRLAEPEASSLVRAAELSLKPSPKDIFTYRLFLGEGRGLAVLLHRRSPLAWKEFDWREGEESPAILAALSFLKTSSKHVIGETNPSRIMIHGRPDLKGRLDTDEIGLATSIDRIDHADGPAPTPANVAYGLALSGQEDDPDLDLIRRTKALDRIAEIFPWSELLLQIVLLLAVWLSLDGFHRSIQADRDALRAKIVGISWLKSQNEGELTKEKTSLELKLKAIDGFLQTRTDWAALMTTLASKMPEKVLLEQFIGQNEIELVNKASALKVAKSIVMKFQAQLDSAGHVPKEVDELVHSLRTNGILTSDFPVVDIVDLKTSQGNQANVPTATFSVICAPKPKKVVVTPSPK